MSARTDRRRALLAGALALLLRASGASAATAPAPVIVGDHERLLVIAPHPDDETIGAAGLMQRVLAKGGTVEVILLTAGDGYVDAVRGETGLAEPKPADYIAYGERRLGESRAALREIEPDPGRARLAILGFPDGGLDSLLSAHWPRSNPARSRTTGATDPPYDADALVPSLPYVGEGLRRQLATLIRQARPTIIALPDPRDVHPDHHATAMFALLAIEDLLRGVDPKAESGGERPPPRLLAYLVHWPAWPPGWDAPASSPGDARAALQLPADLPNRGGHPVELRLSDDEIDGKHRAMARHVSQSEQMPVYLSAFVRRSEPFTILAPAELHADGALARFRAPLPRR